MKRRSRAKAEQVPGSDTVVTVPTLPRDAASDTPTAAKYSEEDVRRRAYELYQSRNGASGDPVADWYAAEEELRKLSAI